MKKILDYLIPIICLFAAVMSIFMGINSINNHNEFMETTGVIESITIEHMSRNHNDYDIMVSYVANGQEYLSDLGEYSSSMEVGQEIDIMYNPENPGEIITAGNFSTIMMFVMAAIAVCATVLSIKKIIKRRERQNNQG